MTEVPVAHLTHRLTARDRGLLRLLWRHRVLTTLQITDAAFNSVSSAQHRLITLTRLGVVARFRPLRPIGGDVMHYVVGPAGAAVLAAERDITVKELGYRPHRLETLAFVPYLGHLIGVNGFFTSLLAAARRDTATGLDIWWSEHECTKTWGDFIRPDGYGHWHENNREIDFFLEYDTGTQRPLSRVTKKFIGYGDLAVLTELRTPVLIYTSSALREANLHRELRRANLTVPVATSTPEARPEGELDWSPAGPIWLPITCPRTRVRLIDLAALPASTGSPR